MSPTGRSLNIALDVDGVLRDFVSSLQHQYTEDYIGFDNHWMKPVSKWDLAEFFSIGASIYQYIYEERTREIFYRARPYQGAVDFVKTLRYLGHKVIICTSQNKDSFYYTFEWLEKCDILYDGIFCKIDSFLPKSMLDVDLLLDDYPNNCDNRNKDNFILMDRPWNQESNLMA